MSGYTPPSPDPTPYVPTDYTPSGYSPSHTAADYGSQPAGAPKSQALGITALVVSIIAFLLGWLPIFGTIAAIIGLGLGIAAIVKRQHKGLSITATVLSVIALITSIVMTILAGTIGQEALKELEARASMSASTSDSSASSESQSGNGQGSRNNPYAIGTTISSADWDVVINSITLNSTEAVLAASSINEAPPEGYSYALINVTATFKGKNSEITDFVGFAYVGNDGTVIRENMGPDGEGLFALAPDPDFSGKELYAGGSATGNVILAVPDSPDGLLRVTPGIIADEVFVSLS